MIGAGAVNGVPAKINARTPGSLTIPYANNGVPAPFTVQPSGSPHAPTGSGPDRVAIIGGSTVGRDHFPFSALSLSDVSALEIAIGSYATGSGKMYPASISLEQLAEWYWLVKSWAVAISLNFTFDAQDGGVQPIYNHSYSGTIIVPMVNRLTNIAVSRESELVTNNLNEAYTKRLSIPLGHFRNYDDLEVVVTDAPDAVAYLEFEMDLFATDAANLWILPAIYDGGSFWPRLFLSIVVGVEWEYTYDEGTEDETTEVFLSGLLISTPFSGPSNLSGSLDGITLPLQRNTVEGVTGTTTFSSASVSITPIEYWPYATKAGLPVYDTSTGAQLRDPFS